MLMTPLGSIQISIDGEPIEYKERLVSNDRTCPNLNGRYAISVHFKPNGKEHFITCRIQSYVATDRDYVETGERLELKSFFKNDVKMSIGMEGETGYFPDSNRLSDYYDYDNEYLSDGVQFHIFSNTKTQDFVFGIAWINVATSENEVQTWYGADPTMFLKEH